MPIDRDAIAESYANVRSDASGITWAAFGYDDKDIKVIGEGENYDDFLALCTEDSRVYGYIRITTGDEMSVRAKFALVTWIGPAVSVLKKAKVSTDKAFVKEVCTNFAVEILADQAKEISLDYVTAQVQKAGGANYGTGR